MTFLTDHPLLVLATIAAAIAAFGAIQDYRHGRRRDLDKVSLIAWGRISIFAMIVAIVCLARGLHSVVWHLSLDP